MTLESDRVVWIWTKPNHDDIHLDPFLRAIVDNIFVATHPQHHGDT